MRIEVTLVLGPIRRIEIDVTPPLPPKSGEEIMTAQRSGYNLHEPHGRRGEVSGTLWAPEGIPYGREVNLTELTGGMLLHPCGKELVAIIATARATGLRFAHDFIGTPRDAEPN